MSVDLPIFFSPTNTTEYLILCIYDDENSGGFNDDDDEQQRNGDGRIWRYERQENKN